MAAPTDDLLIAPPSAQPLRQDDAPGDDHGTVADDAPGDDHGLLDDDAPGDDHGLLDDDPPGDDHGLGDDDAPGDDHGPLSDDPPGDDNGHDLFHGGGADDVFDGGSGIDTVVLAGALAQYTIVKSDDGSIATQGQGSDRFMNVERLEFGDAKLAFDLDGSAGMTVKLLGALLGASAVEDKALVAAGLQLFDGGLGYEQVAGYGISAMQLDALSDDSFVRLLYDNVVGAAPSDGDAGYFAGLLADGAYTRTSLVLLAAESELNTHHVDLVGLGEHGVAYG